MDSILISERILKEIIQRARESLPFEVCGFLFGRNLCFDIHVPVTNISIDTDRFEMKPEEQTSALFEAETYGYELVGIYHSHPEGPRTPSFDDMSKLAYPNAFVIICSCVNEEWRLNGYKIRGTRIVPIEFTTSTAS